MTQQTGMTNTQILTHGFKTLVGMHTRIDPTTGRGQLDAAELQYFSAHYGNLWIQLSDEVWNEVVKMCNGNLVPYVEREVFQLISETVKFDKNVGY